MRPVFFALNHFTAGGRGGVAEADAGARHDPEAEHVPEHRRRKRSDDAAEAVRMPPAVATQRGRSCPGGGRPGHDQREDDARDRVRERLIGVVQPHSEGIAFLITLQA